MPYNSKQDAVNALRPGWQISGEAPHMVKVPNPQAGLAGQPAEIEQQQGIVLSIQDPNNPQATPDTIVIKEVGNNPSTKGGVGFDVIQGPQKAIPATAAKATPAAGLERLDANLQPTNDPAKTVYVRDPAAPAGTQPFKVDAAGELGDPSTWTPIYDPNDTAQVNRRVIGYYDPKVQKVAASVPSSGGNKPSDPNNWTPVYRSPGDKTSGVVGQWDPVNNELHAVANVDGKQIVTTQSAIYVVDKDSGKSTLVTNIDKSQPFQLANVDGVPYRFDPNEKDPTKALVKIGEGQTLPKSVTQNNVTYTLNPSTNQYELPPGAPKPTTMTGSGTQSKYLITYDATTGEELSRKDNPNYQAPTATPPPVNTTAPMILQQDPQDPSKLIWVENKGQVLASDALKNLATHLSGQVVSGKVTVDEAKSIIDAANSKMTNDINQRNSAVTAASNALTSLHAGAQTGAGLLQNRVTAATGMANQAMSLLGSGNFAGGVGLPSGWGSRLLGGLQAWATDLGGGQGTYDAAADMVKQAAPSISGDPTLAAQAYQALRGLMDLHTAQTGQPSPMELNQLSQRQNAGQGGMPAPVTVSPAGPTTQSVNEALQATQTANAQAAGTAGQPTTAQLNGAGYADNPVGRAQFAAKMPPAGIGKWPPPAAAAASPQTFTPPGGSTYSYPTSPWNAAPGPAFPQIQPLPMPTGFQAPAAA